MKFAKIKVSLTALFLVFSLLSFPLAVLAGDGAEVPLDEIKTHIESYYVEPVNAELLEGDDVEKLLEGLEDPYSFYMDPKGFEDFKISTDQEYGGIGMQVEFKDNYVTVVKVFPKTPAEQAGVRAGDKIAGINGEEMAGRDQSQVVDLIRGEPGTIVLISFIREGEPEPVLFSLTREVIHLQVLEYEMLEEGIGYVKLDSFVPAADDEFSEAVNELKKQGLRGLVFDLRHNPGGYLTSALGIGADFTGVGKPLLHVVNKEGKTQTFQSLTPAFDFPVVVLVDGASASASEVVSGIIQDSEAGVLVGTQTFGKASVQTVFPLSNGGGLKLTTAKYLTPKEREINGVGLTPDYVVEDPEAQLPKAVEVLKEKIAQLPSPKEKISIVLFGSQAEVNGRQVAVEPAPYRNQNRTLVPLRFVAEALGAAIGWDGDKQQIDIALEGKHLAMVVGRQQLTIDGSAKIMDVSPQLKDGRTFVPLRFLAEALGAKVDYDSQTGKITITK